MQNFNGVPLVSFLMAEQILVGKLLKIMFSVTYGKKLSLRKGRWVKMVTTMNRLYHTDFYFFFILSILKSVGEKDAFASSQ